MLNVYARYDDGHPPIARDEQGGLQLYLISKLWHPAIKFYPGSTFVPLPTAFSQRMQGVSPNYLLIVVS